MFTYSPRGFKNLAAEGKGGYTLSIGNEGDETMDMMTIMTMVMRRLSLDASPAIQVCICIQYIQLNNKHMIL
jgi:hypothetical protein